MSYASPSPEPGCTALCERVEQFVTDATGYFAHTRGGRTLVIVRAEALVAPISDVDAYVSYLWVEALSGFFLLGQQVVGAAARPWYLLAEVVPVDPYGFFQQHLEGLLGRLDHEQIARDLQRAWDEER